MAQSNFSYFFLFFFSKFDHEIENAFKKRSETLKALRITSEQMEKKNDLNPMPVNMFFPCGLDTTDSAKLMDQCLIILEKFHYPWEMMPLVYVILKGVHGNVDRAIVELTRAQNKVFEYSKANNINMYDGSDLRAHARSSVIVGPAFYNSPISSVGISKPEEKTSTNAQSSSSLDEGLSRFDKCFADLLTKSFL